MPSKENCQRSWLWAYLLALRLSVWLATKILTSLDSCGSPSCKRGFCSIFLSSFEFAENPSVCSPFILGITICTCQIVALGLFGALLHAVGKVSVWASLHLAVAALRTLTLSLLTLSYTNAFKKSDFIPAAQAQAPESYGTFNSNDNTTQQSQAEPVGVVEHAEQKQKKDEPGFKAFFQRIKILSPYLWPKSSTALQLVALICFGLLIAGRVVNLLVPLYLGRLVSALASGSSPWLYLSLFVGLKFLQGSGGILQAMQSILWVPVSQYNDRSK